MVKEENLYTIGGVGDATDVVEGDPESDTNINGTVRVEFHQELRSHEWEALLKEAVEEEYANLLRIFLEVEVSLGDHGEHGVDYFIERCEGQPHFIQLDAQRFHLEGEITKRCKYCDWLDEMTDYTPEERLEWLVKQEATMMKIDPDTRLEYLRCNKYSSATHPSKDADAEEEGLGKYCTAWILAKHRREDETTLLELFTRLVGDAGDDADPDMDTALDRMKEFGVTYKYRNLYNDHSGFLAEVTVTRGEDVLTAYIENIGYGHMVKSIRETSREGPEIWTTS